MFSHKRFSGKVLFFKLYGIFTFQVDGSVYRDQTHRALSTELTILSINIDRLNYLTYMFNF